jgi:hypothetical protein
MIGPPSPKRRKVRAIGSNIKKKEGPTLTNLCGRNLKKNKREKLQKKGPTLINSVHVVVQNTELMQSFASDVVNVRRCNCRIFLKKVVLKKESLRIAEIRAVLRVFPS